MKHNVLLDVTYDYIKDTDSPDVLLYKTDLKSSFVGLMLSTGDIITQQVIPLNRIKVFVHKNTTFVNVLEDKKINIYKISKSKGVIYCRLIVEDCKYYLCGVTEKCLGISDKEGRVYIANHKGKMVNTEGYLQILEHLKEKKLIGVRYLTIGSNGMTDRRVDILSDTGKIEEKNVTWTPDKQRRYLICESSLYHRGLQVKQIKIKTMFGKEVATCNGSPFIL